MNGGPSNVTSTQTTSFPAWAQQIGNSALGGFQNYMFPDGQLQSYPYPPQQVYGYTPAQIQGMNQATQLAGGGAGTNVANAALQNALATQSGEMLTPQSNPYLSNMYNVAAQQMSDQYRYATAPETAAQFAMAHNFGGSANQDVQTMNRFGLGQNLANLATNLYGGAYQQGIQNQLQQQQMLPTLLGAPFIDPQMLQQIGGQQQQFGQNVLNTAYQNMMGAAQWPYTAAQEMASLFSPFVGGQGTSISTQPNPNQMSPLQAFAGGGLGSLGLLQLLFPQGIP